MFLKKYHLGDTYEWEVPVARAPWATLGWSFVHWLLVLVLGAVSAGVWYSFMIDTGESYAGSFFVSEIYLINPVTYPLGCILFLVGYYVIWKRYLKPDWKALAGYFWLWKAGYIVLSLIAIVALFFVFLMIMFLYCGLTISVHPRWTEDVIFVFPAYAVLMPIVDLCVGRYQRLKG